LDHLPAPYASFVEAHLSETDQCAVTVYVSGAFSMKLIAAPTAAAPKAKIIALRR
jgi:hypothetical protein